MEAFLVSISTVGLAEMGDRTQLLSLLLAARYRKPWPIIGGILVATIANHSAAGVLGAWFGRLLTPVLLDGAVGVSMLAMALWALRPDSLEGDEPVPGRGAFAATAIAFFIAEFGDKTQIATIGLAAAYPALAAVIAGTTSGMLLANVPVVFLGKTFAQRLPLKAIRYGAAALFVTLGGLFVGRALLP